MNKIKCLILFPCLIFFILSATISVNKAKPVKQKKTNVVELKFSTGFSANHTMQTQVFEIWAKKINQLTRGELAIKFFPAGALGKDQYALVEKGVADIAYTLHDYTPGRFKMTEVFELPFMIPDAETASIALWTLFEQFPEFRKEYSNVKVLALFCHPPGHFYTIEKPIMKVNDFKGMKFRTVNPFVTSALKIFGAIPVQIPANETMDALKKGTLNGTVFPWEGVTIFKIDNIVKYSTIANFYTETMMVIMNKEKFNSLPDNVKKIIDQNSGMTLSKECGHVYDVTDAPFRELVLKKGVTEFNFVQRDKKKLEAFTLPLRVRWVKEMDSNKLPGKQVLKRALELLEKDNAR